MTTVADQVQCARESQPGARSQDASEASEVSPEAHCPDTWYIYEPGGKPELHSLSSTPSYAATSFFLQYHPIVLLCPIFDPISDDGNQR